MMKKLIKKLKEKIQAWLEIKKESPATNATVAEPPAPSDIPASITINDLEDIFLGMTEAERKTHMAEASLIYNNPVFKVEMRRLFGKQALHLAIGNRDPEELRYFELIGLKDHEQSILGRGTLNGISLVEERFKQLNSMHLGELQKPKSTVEDKDKYNLMPQI